MKIIALVFGFIVAAILGATALLLKKPKGLADDEEDVLPYKDDYEDLLKPQYAGDVDLTKDSEFEALRDKNLKDHLTPRTNVEEFVKPLNIREDYKSLDPLEEFERALESGDVFRTENVGVPAQKQTK